MTPNDISTPKKAEDATRHPLELLRQLQPEVETLLGFIRGAVTYHADPNHIESVLGILTQNGLEKLNLLAVCSPHEAQREALIHRLMDENATLRAQAEAEAGLREGVERIAEEAAELRQNLRANWVCCTSPVYADGFQSAMNRADALDRAARTALAQAGETPTSAPQVCKFHGKSYCGPEDGFACMSPSCFALAQAGAGSEGGEAQ